MRRKEKLTFRHGIRELFWKEFMSPDLLQVSKKKIRVCATRHGFHGTAQLPVGFRVRVSWTWKLWTFKSRRLPVTVNRDAAAGPKAASVGTRRLPMIWSHDFIATINFKLSFSTWTSSSSSSWTLGLRISGVTYPDTNGSVLYLELSGWCSHRDISTALTRSLDSQHRYSQAPPLSLKESLVFNTQISLALSPTASRVLISESSTNSTSFKLPHLWGQQLRRIKPFATFSRNSTTI
jgi:hypothetical protein